MRWTATMALLFAVGRVALPCEAQGARGPAAAQAAASAQQPLEAMPYSPTLDVTSLDRSVQPCEDFYAFSCGGWKAKNPIPPDQASWSVYAKLANDNQQFLWGILKEDAGARVRTPVQQKVGDYFASCMNTAAIDARGEQPIRPYLAMIDGLRTRGEMAGAIATINHALPGSYFFDAGVQQDSLDSSVMTVVVLAGGLGLPDRDYYLRTGTRDVALREAYVAYVQRLLGLAGETEAQAKSDAASILRIETALAAASLTRVDRRDPHKVYHPMTLVELGALAPEIDWVRYFAVQGAPGMGKLNVAQPEFMKAMGAELNGETVEALRAYLRFHLLTASAPHLASRFEAANFDFYSKTLRGVAAMPPRWKTCTRAVDDNLGEALGQEFVRRTFSAETRARTQEMTAQIEAAMGQEIEGLTWMSAATKGEALRKLHAIRNKIGFPEHWRDYTALTVTPDDYFGNSLRADRFEDAREWHKLGKPVDLTEWGMTPPTVNAYFNPRMNDINFPAGVLQPPLYDPAGDDAPNYGNTGATIGHELTHGFDDQGRQFDDKGGLRDWWTAGDAKGFEERLSCVRDQYAGYVVVDDIHINAKLTSGEDVADLGGTLLAYMAWKKQTEGMTLQPKDGFTPEQRFFVGNAQWACENDRPEVQRLHAATDPHSPGIARVNGVMSNLPEFARAFGCKAGQPMVHAPTCKIW